MIHHRLSQHRELVVGIREEPRYISYQCCHRRGVACTPVLHTSCHDHIELGGGGREARRQGA